MVWPEHGCFLIPGVNDTWNEFQKSLKGRVATTQDWKTIREILHSEYENYLAKGGIPARAEDESRRQEHHERLLNYRMQFKTDFHVLGRGLRFRTSRSWKSMNKRASANKQGWGLLSLDPTA
jgi:hypothetical protein